MRTESTTINNAQFNKNFYRPIIEENPTYTLLEKVKIGFKNTIKGFVKTLEEYGTAAGVAMRQ
ncbi:hypothetical protein Q4Q34_14305 [Flavivirga abyssicola]|uniref:hypothetical protein n=1 Tax=Flavivirga abyssicola TaxID=3063533 RepID=UPI0026DF9CC6|nr:hypothetical protein [Flavivirga sp. MEBiC07777]WVK12395.1 hypothetical protein Q4Q34_14305 [Flavivirga sp. MEBiC07777]